MKEKIFLHFLNREMYRSLGLSEFTGVNDIIRILLLSCKEDLCVPLSSVWESAKCNDLDYQFFQLIYNAEQVNVISDCITIDEFLERNRNLYKFDKSRYQDIYFKEANIITNIYPTELKERSTTETISNKIESWQDQADIGILLPKNDISILHENRPTILKVNEEREEKALTVSLFSKYFPNLHDCYAISRFLSMCYIKDYCNFLGADIVTGISNLISFYDVLAESYPYYDIRLLKWIICYVSSNNKIPHYKNVKDWYRILEKRKNGDLDRVYTLIREIIEQSLINLNIHELNDSKPRYIKKICQYIQFITKHLTIQKVNSIKDWICNDALMENLQNILKALTSSEYTIIYKSINNIQCKNKEYLKGSSKMENKLFISHSSKDEKYVQIIIELLEGIGLTESQMVCTSIPGYGVPLNEDIYDYLKKQFNNYKLYILFILSDNYYESIASLNEMGAAWVLQNDFTSILLPKFKFNRIKGAIDAGKIGISLDESESKISDLLNQLKSRLQSLFKLPDIADTRWDRLKKTFFDNIKRINTDI